MRLLKNKPASVFSSDGNYRRILAIGACSEVEYCECVEVGIKHDSDNSIFDAEHSRTEDRWITIGKDNNDVPLVVIHTFRETDVNNCKIRIITARKATKKEIKQYSIR